MTPIFASGVALNIFTGVFHVGAAHAGTELEETLEKVNRDTE